MNWKFDFSPVTSDMIALLLAICCFERWLAMKIGSCVRRVTNQKSGPDHQHLDLNFVPSSFPHLSNKNTSQGIDSVH